MVRPKKSKSIFNCFRRLNISKFKVEILSNFSFDALFLPPFVPSRSMYIQLWGASDDSPSNLPISYASVIFGETENINFLTCRILRLIFSHFLFILHKNLWCEA